VCRLTLYRREPMGGEREGAARRALPLANAGPTRRGRASRQQLWHSLLPPGSAVVNNSRASGLYGPIVTQHGAYKAGPLDYDRNAPSVTVLTGARVRQGSLLRRPGAADQQARNQLPLRAEQQLGRPHLPRQVQRARGQAGRLGAGLGHGPVARAEASEASAALWG
jgi:hypothetical protein